MEPDPTLPEPRPVPRIEDPRAAEPHVADGTGASPRVEPLALAEMICARFCHDLSGAAGMLTVLLDLATSRQKEAGEALAEARQAAEDLNARLIVLRAAWTATGEDLAAPRLQAMLAPFLKQRRIIADLSQIDEQSTFSAPVARAVMNAVLLCVEGLPRGGVIAASGEPDGGVLFSIEGPGAAWPAAAALVAASPDPVAELAAIDDPRRLQPQLTAALAETAGMRLALLQRTGSAAPARLLLHRGRTRPTV